MTIIKNFDKNKHSTYRVYSDKNLLTFMGTKHIHFKSNPMLVDAHFTSSCFFSLVPVSSAFPLFFCFLIIKLGNTVGCLPLQTLNSLLLTQLFELLSLEILPTFQ